MSTPTDGLREAINGASAASRWPTSAEARNVEIQVREWLAARVVPSVEPDDLDAFIREAATTDPAFATAYLNAQARATVCGLLALIDGAGAVDWQKIPNGTDNVWLRKAREIDRDATPDLEE